PGDVAELQTITAGVSLIEQPGNYTLRWDIDFANLRQNNGEGEYGFPKKDDWQQVLTTGETPVTIRARTPDDDTREKQRMGSKPSEPTKSPGDKPPGGPGLGAPPKGLEFLAAYPKLHGLSLVMTEAKFLDLVERERLKPRKSTQGGDTSYWIPTGDGHTV